MILPPLPLAAVPRGILKHEFGLIAHNDTTGDAGVGMAGGAYLDDGQEPPVSMPQANVAERLSLCITVDATTLHTHHPIPCLYRQPFRTAGRNSLHRLMLTGGGRLGGLDRHHPGSVLASLRPRVSDRGARFDFLHQQHVVEHDVPLGIIVIELKLQRLASDLGQRVNDQLEMLDMSPASPEEPFTGPMPNRDFLAIGQQAQPGITLRVTAN